MSGQYYEETNSLDPDEDDDGGKWWQWLLYALLSFGLSGAAGTSSRAKCSAPRVGLSSLNFPAPRVGTPSAKCRVPSASPLILNFRYLNRFTFDFEPIAEGLNFAQRLLQIMGSNKRKLLQFGVGSGQFGCFSRQ